MTADLCAGRGGLHYVLDGDESDDEADDDEEDEEDEDEEPPWEAAPVSAAEAEERVQRVLQQPVTRRTNGVWRAPVAQNTTPLPLSWAMLAPDRHEQPQQAPRLRAWCPPAYADQVMAVLAQEKAKKARAMQRVVADEAADAAQAAGTLLLLQLAPHGQQLSAADLAVLADEAAATAAGAHAGGAAAAPTDLMAVSPAGTPATGPTTRARQRAQVASPPVPSPPEPEGGSAEGTPEGNAGQLQAMGLGRAPGRHARRQQQAPQPELPIGPVSTDEEELLFWVLYPSYSSPNGQVINYKQMNIEYNLKSGQGCGAL